jgi:hypothetical protein
LLSDDFAEWLIHACLQQAKGAQAKDRNGESKMKRTARVAIIAAILSIFGTALAQSPAAASPASITVSTHGGNEWG